MARDFRHRPDQVLAFLRDGVDSGEIPEDVLRQALIRIAAARQLEVASTPASARALAAEIVDDARRHATRAGKTRALLAELTPALGLRPDQVEVRADEEARRRTGARGARGLAEGGRVYLHPDTFDPETSAGRGLLGHEVVHIAQMRGAAAPSAFPPESGRAAEVEAAALGAAFARGGGVTPPRERLPVLAAAADRDAEGATEPSDGGAPPLREEDLLELFGSQPAPVLRLYAARQVGGLTRLRAHMPRACEVVRRDVSRWLGSPTWKLLERHDGRIMALLDKAETLRDLVHAELDRLHGEARTDAYARLYDDAEQWDLSYASIALHLKKNGEGALAILEWFYNGRTVQEIARELVQRAGEHQAQQDERRSQANARQRAARKKVGTVVARRDGILFDDDVRLVSLSDPVEGAQSLDLALAWARSAELTCAVMEIESHWYVFKTDRQYDQGEIWEHEAFREKRSALVPIGRELRAIVTSDGYVLRPRSGRDGARRLFGGDQSERPDDYYEADLELLNDHDAGHSSVQVFKSMVRHSLLSSLAHSRQSLLAARRRLRPQAGSHPPDAREAAQLRKDSAALRRNILVAGRLSAASGPGAGDRDEKELREALAEIGRIVSTNPAAAMMVVDDRDEDERGGAPGDGDIVDRLAGRQASHAAWDTIGEIDERLENIEKVQKHLHADPDSVLDLEPVHELVVPHFSAAQRVGIDLAKVGHSLERFAKAVGMLALDLGALLVGVLSAGVTSLVAYGVSAGLSARGVAQQFEQASLLSAMARLDLTGELALASEEDASSARMWAWIGLGLSFLDLAGFVSGARALRRLRAVTRDPALARILARSQTNLDDLARELGLSRKELVRQLSAGGAARERILERIRTVAMRPLRAMGPAARQGLRHATDEELAAVLRHARGNARHTEELLETYYYKCVKGRSAYVEKYGREPPTLTRWLDEGIPNVQRAHARGFPAGFADRAQFERFGSALREELAAKGYPARDLRVGGSGVYGTTPGDVDVYVMVSPREYEALVAQSFKTPAAGSARWKTMMHAQTTGKLTAGNLRPPLRGLRDVLAGISDVGRVDLSIIRVGSPFDSGPFLAIP